MRKCVVFMISMVCLLFIASPVYAKDKTVKISAASGTTSSMQISGETEALAVVVQIRNANNDILAIRSIGTVDGKFNETIEENITLEEGQTYTVYVADYEGSDWSTMKMTISSSTDENSVGGAQKEQEEAKSPKTGDNSVSMEALIILLLGICFVAAGITMKWSKGVDSQKGI